jgi:integrase
MGPSEMKLFKRKDREKSPWGVTYMEGEKRVRRYFTSESGRREFVRGLELELFDEPYNAQDWATWLRIKQACEEAGISPEALIPLAHQHGAGLMDTKLTLSKAISGHLDALSRRKMPMASQHHRKLALTRLEAFLGPGRAVTELNGKAFQSWFDQLDGNAVTLANNKKHVRAWWNWMVQRKFATGNPLAEVDLPKVKSKEPEIIPVDDMRRFFAANEAKDPGICALMALGAFAGLRTSTIYRIERGDIDMTNRTILLPGEKLKTDRRHLIQGVPPVLWQWLKLLDDDDLGHETDEKHEHRKKRRLDERRKRACIRAGVQFPHNGLRHSFITYHAALKGNAHEAAMIAGHRDSRITWAHYKGIATKAQAKDWFALEPHQKKS